MSDKPKDDSKDESKHHPFPLTHYAFIIFAMVMLCVPTSFEAVKAQIPVENPDQRSTLELTKDTMHQRRRLSKKIVGEIDDDRVTLWHKRTIKQMQMMHFIPSDEPKKPEPPKIDGNGLKAKAKFELAKRDYPDVLKAHEQDVKLWKKNNETREKEGFVILQGVKYVKYPNLFSFVLEARYNSIAAGLYARKNHKNWKDQLGWLHKGFEEFKQKKGIEGKKGMSEEEVLDDQKLFREYVTEEYMGQPLVAPKWVGDYGDMKTWEGTTWEDGQALAAADKALREAKRTLKSAKDDGAKKKAEAAVVEAETKVKVLMAKGRPCYLVKPLAEMVTLANRRMHKAGKGQIRPMTCYRNTFQQAVLWNFIKGKKPHLPAKPKDGLLGWYKKKRRVKVNAAGWSNHQLGLAMDLSNVRAAAPFLAITAGMLCGYLKGDRGHCAVGEANLNKKVIRGWKAFLDTYADGSAIKNGIIDKFFNN